MAELHGAFVAFEPGGYRQASKTRIIPFRFNPEGLSRSLSIDPGQATQGVEGNARGNASSTNEQSADASAGTLKETFNVQVRVDLVDRLESAVSLDPKFGILPEISALEDLLYPAESDSDANSDGKEAVRHPPQRPTVLFLWGTKRRFAVKITQMTINETLYNEELYPVRAEVDVALEVLRSGDAADNPAVRDALDFNDRNRRDLSRMFLDGAAAQNTNVPPY